MQLGAPAPSVHLDRLVGALDRAHATLEDVPPVLADVEAGTPRNVSRVEEAFNTAGSTLATASSHAARAGRVELIQPLAGAAARLLGTSSAFHLPAGARTWPASSTQSAVEGARGLQGETAQLIEQVRAVALGHAAVAPPREDVDVPAPPPEGGPPEADPDSVIYDGS